MRQPRVWLWRRFGVKEESMGVPIGRGPYPQDAALGVGFIHGIRSNQLRSSLHYRIPSKRHQQAPQSISKTHLLPCIATGPSVLCFTFYWTTTAPAVAPRTVHITSPTSTILASPGFNTETSPVDIHEAGSPTHALQPQITNVSGAGGMRLVLVTMWVTWFAVSAFVLRTPFTVVIP